MESNLRKLVRRHGTVRLTIALTAIMVFLSASITMTITTLLNDGFSWTALALSIVTPLLLVPLFEFRTFRVLHQLDQAEEKLRALSITDELTGTYNRRYFFEIASQELARTQRYGGFFSIAIMDFDNFKRINDTYGHLTGDLALQAVSKICRENARATDFFARYGGDEFVFLFPHTTYEEALEGLDRLRKEIESRPIGEYEDVAPRVSIGLAVFNSNIASLDDLLQQADLALYRAKKEGGNAIH